MDSLRKCPRCKNSLSRDCYTKASWKKGVGNPCRKCDSEIRKAKRILNPDKFKQLDKLRYQRYKNTSIRDYDFKKKYGLSRAEIETIFDRQNGKCLGCLSDLSWSFERGKRFHVDHSHTTNIVRGLLCPKCNTTLGLVNESPATLRRLMAYLDRDPSKILIYLIGQLKNSRIPELGNMLRSCGFDVMDEWFTPGAEADENWQKYEKLRGRSYKEALRGRSATNTFLFDRAYLDMSDIAIVVAPFGKSAMIEAGYAKGRNKKVILFLDNQEPDRYDVMPGFVDIVCKTEEELLEELNAKGL